MNEGRSRRKFIKQLIALSAFSSVSFLSFKRGGGAGSVKLGPTEAHAMHNPDYAVCNSKDRIRIEYMGMSCFLTT